MKLTVAALRELISYDPETGIFQWKTRRRGRLLSGHVGDRTRSGYLRVGISYQRYLLHRLAWLYMTGEWPKQEIDHINGIRDDNRFANLREATVAQNRANMRMRSSNRIGVKGVRWRADCSMWEARICKNYKKISIGYFGSPQEAHTAYMAKARELFGKFARSG
jgi:hypothetical protein